MDFGLARGLTAPASAAASAQSGMPSFTATPTLSNPVSPLTSEGTVLGTLNYMSPEQIEGKEADARSDIFAFGCVLYEMAIGKRAFEGKSHISVASAILEKDPEPILATQPLLPIELGRVAKTALKKEPAERFESVHDFKLQLEWIAEGSAARLPSRTWMPWAILSAAVLLAVAAFIVSKWEFSHPSQSNTYRASLLAPENASYPAIPWLAVSPDGSRMAFVRAGDKQGSQRLVWVRSLDGLTAQPLSGTEGAGSIFWSPDSHAIGFFTDDLLKRVDASGGAVQILCAAPKNLGGTWGGE